MEAPLPPFLPPLSFVTLEAFHKEAARSAACGRGTIAFNSSNRFAAQFQQTSPGYIL